MAEIPITLVRYPEKQAYDVLWEYIFGNRYTSPRPPRGLPPDVVARFVVKELKADSNPRAYERALEAMRFYEATDVTPHLRQYLAGREASFNDLRRSAFIVQALGDMGTPEDARWGSDYFDRKLTRKAAFADAVEVLLETLLALAPAGGPAAFAERVRTEISNAPGSQTGRKLSEIAANRLPGTEALIGGKKRLLGTPPGARRAELVSIYLGQSDLSEPYMVTWAGRMIRREAMESDPTPIYADFGRAIDAAAPKKSSDSEAGFVIVRAAQAILYLQGNLTGVWRQLYESSHPENMRNFLWDDVS